MLDAELSWTIAGPVVDALDTLGVHVEFWVEVDSPPLGVIDALLLAAERLEVADDRFRLASRKPRLVVLIEGPTPSDTRLLLLRGVSAVVDVVVVDPLPQAIQVLAAAVGGCLIPSAHGPELATKLSDPPRVLTREEQIMLALAATRSIEATGEHLGLSRRQIQRRFRGLLDDLGIPSHLHAAVAATKWGLGEGPSKGQR